jgi:tubulin polyglutamylase TTLL9
LLEDVLNVIDLENRLAIYPRLIITSLILREFVEIRLLGKEKRIGGFDLIWDDGPVFADEGGFESSTSLTPLNSFLG